MDRTSLGFGICFCVAGAALYFSLLHRPPSPPDPRLNGFSLKDHHHDIYVDIAALAALEAKIGALTSELEQHEDLLEHYRSDLGLLSEQLNEIHTLALRGDGAVGLSTIIDELAEEVRDNGHLTRQNVLAILNNTKEIGRAMHLAGHAHGLGHKALGADEDAP